MNNAFVLESLKTYFEDEISNSVNFNPKSIRIKLTDGTSASIRITSK